MRIRSLPLAHERHENLGKPQADITLGDALDTARAAKDRAAKGVQLIYLDPPFCTGKRFGYKARVGDRGYAGESSARLQQVAYTDPPLSKMPEFIERMRQIFVACRDLLESSGLLFLHVDQRSCAYMRVALDEIFGIDRFVNEIIWHYKTGGRSTRYFSHKHDNILVYAKSRNFFMDLKPIGVPRGSAPRNHMKRQMDEAGNVFYTIRSGGKLYTYGEQSLVYPSDVWDDVAHLQQRDPQRFQYDTQKPEALLERILAVASKPGDTVADFFMGTATTAAVAARIGRNFVGGDASQHAVNIARERLLGRAQLDVRYARPAGGAPCSLRLGYRVEGDVLRLCLRGFALPGVTLPPPIPTQISVMEAGKWEEVGLQIDCEEQPVDIQAINYMALGCMQGDCFVAQSVQQRSAQAPVLSPLLSARVAPGQAAALQIVDAVGNTHCFQLSDWQA